jgi:pimeloyl-ACP methyl ester carboxylesterase
MQTAMHRIDANGTSISFTRGGEGPPLILLHGAEADHSMFDAFAALLAPNFSVIAYDQRDSGGTRNPATPYGLAELADDAAALIAALGFQRAHVFGTSLGGAIAQALAVRHPARIERLVLASTFRVGTPLALINPQDFPRFAELRAGLPQTLSEFATFFFPPDHITAHPEALDIFKSNTRTAEQRQRRGAILSQQVQIDLATITVPTLVLAGAEDRLIPAAHTLSLARELPNAVAVAIAGAGHVGTIQKPAAVAAEVRAFLQNKRPQERQVEGNDGYSREASRGGSRQAL